PDADAPPRSTFAELTENRFGAGEPAFRAPALADRPGKPRLDRRRRLVDVLAVQAQARLEPQRVAGAQASRLDLGLGEQTARQRLHVCGGHRDLEPVLAGVAGAGDQGGHAVEHEEARTHEWHGPALRRETAEDLRRGRPLKGEQGAGRELLDLATL